jgi:ABC-type amino acid transport substrate-binding protein
MVKFKGLGVIMNNKLVLKVLLFAILSLFSLHSQVLKAAVLQNPDINLPEFYRILSEKSGIKIHQISLLRDEVENALKEGIIDIAILPDNEKTRDVALLQTRAFGKNYALVSEKGVLINEYNLVDLRTIAVYMDDEAYLNEVLIEKYSLDTRIQKARHYDSLVRIMATGRVAAIFIPLQDFERSLSHMNEDREKFGQPFPLGYKEDYLVLSKRRADTLSPLMNRLIQALDTMKQDGILNELD